MISADVETNAKQEVKKTGSCNFCHFYKRYLQNLKHNVKRKIFHLRDCRQITFVTLNGFCPLSNPPPPPPHPPTPVLNGQYQIE